MKQTMAMAAIFSVLLAAGTAGAAEKETELEFDKAKLWNLAGLPVYFFLENFLHESSHALVVKSFGATIEEFKPYPHRADDGTLLMGGFYPAGKKMSARQEAVVAVAPYMLDAVLFTSTDLLLAHNIVDPKSAEGVILYSVGMLAPFVNLVYNAHGFGPYNDFVIFSKAAGVNRFATLAVTEGVAIVAAYRLITQGVRVFSKNIEPAKKSVKPALVNITPILGHGMTGLGASFTF